MCVDSGAAVTGGLIVDQISFTDGTVQTTAGTSVTLTDLLQGTSVDFSGGLQAASLYTQGSLDAATATFTGLLQGTSATFTDLLQGTNADFSGGLQAASVYTLGSLDAATATLTGLLQGTSATFTDLLQGTSADFSGGLQAASVYTLGSLDAATATLSGLLQGTSATFTDNVTVLNEASVRRLYAEDMLLRSMTINYPVIKSTSLLSLTTWIFRRGDRPPTGMYVYGTLDTRGKDKTIVINGIDVDRNVMLFNFQTTTNSDLPTTYFLPITNTLFIPLSNTTYPVEVFIDTDKAEFLCSGISLSYA
jgi:uncharacterized membrane protein YoaK (UPF0700 family)